MLEQDANVSMSVSHIHFLYNYEDYMTNKVSLQCYLRFYISDKLRFMEIRILCVGVSEIKTFTLPVKREHFGLVCEQWDFPDSMMWMSYLCVGHLFIRTKAFLIMWKPGGAVESGWVFVYRNLVTLCYCFHFTYFIYLYERFFLNSITW